MADLLLFFGAGASKPLGIPTNREFWGQFLESEYKPRGQLDEFAHEFHNALSRAMLVPPDLEAIMTALAGLASKEPHEALVFAGGPAAALANAPYAPQFFEPTARALAGELGSALKEHIMFRCSDIDRAKVQANYEPIVQAFWAPHREWRAGRRKFTIGGQDNSRGHGPVPLFSCFTTNYDLALEAYFDGRGIEYRRGFSASGGHLRFDPEDLHHRGSNFEIVKLHGSVDMLRLDGGPVIISPTGPTSGRTLSGSWVKEQALIFPTQEKELMRSPFIDYYYEFARELRRASIWLFAGFSFRDAPIQNLLQSEVTDQKKIIVLDPIARKIIQEQLGEVRKIATVCPVQTAVGDADVTDAIATWREK